MFGMQKAGRIFQKMYKDNYISVAIYMITKSWPRSRLHKIYASFTPIKTKGKTAVLYILIFIPLN